ncbi:hypothetical protein VDGL01_07903 [Verticillium dahliae]
MSPPPPHYPPPPPPPTLPVHPLTAVVAPIDAHAITRSSFTHTNTGQAHHAGPTYLGHSAHRPCFDAPLPSNVQIEDDEGNKSRYRTTQNLNNTNGHKRNIRHFVPPPACPSHPVTFLRPTQRRDYTESPTASRNRLPF